MVATDAEHTAGAAGHKPNVARLSVGRDGTTNGSIVDEGGCMTSRREGTRFRGEAATSTCQDETARKRRSARRGRGGDVRYERMLAHPEGRAMMWDARKDAGNVARWEEGVVAGRLAEREKKHNGKREPKDVGLCKGIWGLWSCGGSLAQGVGTKCGMSKTANSTQASSVIEPGSTVKCRSALIFGSDLDPGTAAAAVTGAESKSRT